VKPAPARFEEITEPKTIQKSSPFRSVERLSVTVGGHGEPRAEVQITHRNGTIEMAVRTPHPELAHDLRSALPELGSALESRGFRSEIREVARAPESQQDTSDKADNYGAQDERQRRHRRELEREQDD
jgi:hypothetical protein